MCIRDRGVTIPSNAIIDVQVKRIHEYKRQQMLALYIIWKYLDIKNGNRPKHPVTIIFGGKAAPAYTIAQDIIHLILKQQQMIVENQQLRTESIRNQYEALKNQLNPHMLFNSLNTLQSLIRETPARAVDYTQELSRVLRYTLQSNESRFVTLAEELAFAEAYIFLMKMRYEENLTFDVAVDKQLRDRLLPPMSLQVLIENAIKHNEISNRRPLAVSIRTQGETPVSYTHLTLPTNSRV